MATLEWNNVFANFFPIFDPFTYYVWYWISPQCSLILAAAMCNMGSLAPMILPKIYFYSLQNGLGALLSCPCSLPEVCDRLWVIGGSWRPWMPPWPGGGKLSNLCRRKSRRVAAPRFKKQHLLIIQWRLSSVVASWHIQKKLYQILFCF